MANSVNACIKTLQCANPENISFEPRCFQHWKALTHSLSDVGNGLWGHISNHGHLSDEGLNGRSMHLKKRHVGHVGSERKRPHENIISNEWSFAHVLMTTCNQRMIRTCLWDI